MRPRSSIITLLTDFGVADYFVPSVKGVIVSINPAARIIDLTHDIPPQDVTAGAFTLGACYREFPEGTIHVAVVDPGVGSARRPIIIETADYSFIGPDNGLFSFIHQFERDVRVHSLTNEEYFRHPVCATFHGRDIFAPVAAHHSLGVPDAEFGEWVNDPVSFDIPQPKHDAEQGTIEATILYVDRFGNLITGFTERELQLNDDEKPAAEMILGGRRITQFGSHFAAVAQRGDLFAYPGSAGYWEIALWCGSAAEHLGARSGDRVILEKK